MAFIEEYFVDFNGTRAAQRAGYGGDEATLAAQASRLLKNAKVAKRVAARFAAKAMTADEVLKRLAEHARGDLSEFISEHGAIDWAKVKEKGCLLKSISHTAGKQSKIELYDAQSALALIGKYHRLFVDRREVSGPDGGPMEHKFTSFERILERVYGDGEDDDEANK